MPDRSLTRQIQQGRRDRLEAPRSSESISCTTKDVEYIADKKTWFIAGTDATGIAEQKATGLRQQIDAFRDLSTSLALDNPQSTRNRR